MSDAWKRLENINNSSHVIEKGRTRTDAGDPSGVFPKADFWYQSSLPKGDHTLHVGGDPNINIEAIMQHVSQTDTDPAEASIKQTVSGHVLLFDDAHGSRRILLKHENGTGIEMTNDGTMIMRTQNNIITSVGGSNVVMIEGDLKVSCSNIEVNATGNLDMNIENDYNLTVGGHKKETIKGSSEQIIGKDKRETITGGMYTDVVKSVTNAYMNGVTNVVKGDLKNIVTGQFQMSCTGTAQFSSETTVNMAAPNYNITSEDLTVVGAAGTIGGENMIYYGNSYFGTSAIFTKGITANGVTSTTGMTADTFTGDVVGDVTGVASGAMTANTSPASGGGGQSQNVTNTDTGATDVDTSEQMTAALAKIALEDTDKGYKKVKFDTNDAYKDKIDLSAKTDNVITSRPSSREIRALMKEPTNAENPAFLNYLITERLLDQENLDDKIPPGVGRSYDGNVSYVPWKADAGYMNNAQTYIKGKRHQKKFIPDSRYDPMNPDSYAGHAMAWGGGTYSFRKLVLGEGIPATRFVRISNYAKRFTTTGNFLQKLRNVEKVSRAASLAESGGSKDISSIDSEIVTGLALARQLLLQAEVIKFKRANKQFDDYTITVAEGVYNPNVKTKLTLDSPPALSMTGRAISYEIHNRHNGQEAASSFEFAVRLAESLFGYDKIILDYDSLKMAEYGSKSADDTQYWDDHRDADKIYNARQHNIQVIVIMPEVDENYNPISPSKFELETVFNRQVLSKTDLVEIVENQEAFNEDTDNPTAESEKIIYNYNQDTTRNKKVNDEFEKALSDAAITADLDYVEIFSGKQPGKDGGIKGSQRYNTGSAALVRLVKNGKYLSSANISFDRPIMTKFIKAAIVNGIFGGSHGPQQNSPQYDINAMHLDMLGVFNSGPLQLSTKRINVWKSDDWFYSAFGLPSPN